MIPGVFASVEEDILNEHNRLRRLHRSPDLQLVPYVPDQVHSAANNITEEDKEPPYVRDFPLSVCKTLGDPVKCVQQWYDGVKDYDFDNPGFSDETKYFTALIWKASNHVAVLTKTNQISKNKYVFAFYHPLGNIDGKFKENVPRLNG
ncbi:uncharacterized protein Dwil_GK26749 [Drosophila willistoni]|uniref:SCP domain-containing protein n=2 Tax=Drosophila willistoni TaxID=7260 RepID=A0A0Q9X0B9_DROWI|nr:uncharacterized protein Dwil_GK26749 [Drosophila willistoni]